MTDPTLDPGAGAGGGGGTGGGLLGQLGEFVDPTQSASDEFEQAVGSAFEQGFGFGVAPGLGGVVDDLSEGSIGDGSWLPETGQNVSDGASDAASGLLDWLRNLGPEWLDELLVVAVPLIVALAVLWLIRPLLEVVAS